MLIAKLVGDAGFAEEGGVDDPASFSVVAGDGDELGFELAG